MLSPVRRVIKRYHPEGLPRMATKLYNALSKTGSFQRHYDLFARDILAACPEGRILDVGTGPGWLLMKLHQLSSDLELYGADISPYMAAKAVTNVAASGLSGIIGITAGDVGNLPYADGYFDAVVSTGTIHHWKKPEAGLNEIYRVLKPGGAALMYDLISDTPRNILKQASREFGRFGIMLLWLHSFEEPFYNAKFFEELSRPTLFKEGRTRFVGAFCRLEMKKPE